MRKPYPTDLPDAEWNYIEPHMPASKGHGRPRTHDLREILNAVFYILKSGCQWRLLPHDNGGLAKVDATKRFSSASAQMGRGEDVLVDLSEQEDEPMDYERLAESSEAFVYAAMTRLMVRRLARA
jgi:transposase